MTLTQYHLSNVQDVLDFLEQSMRIDNLDDAEPDPYTPYHEQSVWIQNDDLIYEYEQYFDREDIPPEHLGSFDNCGTACCIAGYLAIKTMSSVEIATMLQPNWEGNWSPSFVTNACEVLGLDNEKHYTSTLFGEHTSREELIALFEEALNTETWDHLSYNSQWTLPFN